MATAVKAAAPLAEEPRRPYIPVFVMLGVLTLIELWVSALAVPWGNRIGALMILAISKGSLVVLYYMHLRYEPRLLSLIPLIPVFMAIGLLVTLIAELI